MTLISTKSPCGVEFPIDTQITIGNHEYVICGLARQEIVNGLVCQWWIVESSDNAH